jgi:uncharacterized protein YjbI with pentapeptide repeats
MTDPLESLQQVSAAIDALGGAPPPPYRWRDLRLVQDKLVSIYPDLTSDSQAFSLHQAHIAYPLWQIALATQAAELLEIIFGIWTHCGPTGWVLGARHLMVKCNRGTREVYASALDNLEEYERLLLLNQYTMDARRAEPSAKALISKLLFTPAVRKPEDYVRLLAILRLYRGTLSPALEDILYRDDFWAWSIAELNPGSKAKRLRNILASLEQLGRPLPEAPVADLLGANPKTDLPLLRAVAKLGLTGQGLEKKILDMLAAAQSPEIKFAALEALIKLNAAGIEKIFLFLLKKRPDLTEETLRRLCLLDTSRLNTLLDRFDEKIRAKADEVLLKTFIHSDPEWVTQFLADYVEKVPRLYQLDQQSLTNVRAFVLEHDKAVLGLPPPADAQHRPPPSRDKEKGGASRSLAKVFKKEAEADPVEQAKERLRDQKNLFGMDLTGRELGNVEASNLSVSHCKFTRGAILGSHFQSVSFRDCAFEACVIDNVYFADCTFENCSFTGARLSKCFLKWTFMKSCDFSKAWLHEGEITGLVCSRSCFEASHLQSMDFGKSMARETSFLRAVLEDCALRASRLEGVDLSDARMVSCQLLGVELLDCVMHRTLLAKTHSHNLTAKGCHFHLVHGYGLHASSQALLYAAHSGRRERLLDDLPARPATTVPDWASSELCSDMTQLLVDNWFPKEDAARKEERYAVYRLRRMDMAMEPQPPKAKELFTLLPYALQFGPPGDARQNGQQSQLNIFGYSPNFSCWDILQKQFEVLDLAEPARNAAPVAGLYAVGQFGSLAQPGGSIAKLMLLLEDAPADEHSVAKLQRRLANVAAFAQKHYAVRLMFSVADARAVREGGYAPSGWEDMTPGQASLRKEELCRTLLPLYGKIPTWWLTPSVGNEQEYGEHQEQLTSFPYFFEERSVDLGFPANIDPKVFFEACLLELADVFTNPFVCLIRYGMLQRFLNNDAPSKIFILDKIKERVFAGSSDLADVDPWAALFRETFIFLTEHGDRKAAELSGLAFALQSGGKDVELALDQAWAGHKSRCVQDLFKETAGAKNILKHCLAAEASFEYMAKSGKVFGAFMHDAVKRISTEAMQSDSPLRVDPSLLELLGRKLDILFSRRKNKVPRIAFLRLMNQRFHYVILFCERTSGRPSKWMLRGVPTNQNISKENLTEICRDEDLARLLLWYVVNGLYDPACRFEVDYTANPVRGKDVQQLLFLMNQFFAHIQHVGFNILLMDKPEIMLRALFVLNLTCKRDVNAIFESSTAYSTSWGEIFCQTSNVYGNQLRDDPKGFLRKSTQATVTPAVKISSFKPEKARCPEIKLSANDSETKK